MTAGFPPSVAELPAGPAGARQLPAPDAFAPRRLAIGRYWRTARHLQATQIVNRLFRWVPEWPSPALPAVPRRVEQPWLADGEHSAGGQRPILHRNAPEGWDPPGTPRLWRYHQHYFEQAADPAFARWASSWIAQNRGGTGWEPYPLSRRIPNWIVWILAGNAPPPGLNESLVQQRRSLQRQIEYHLLGNHLLANWRALVFADCYFAQASPARSARCFTAELERQLLDDGAHQERSPMYHALILADLLDLIQLAGCYRLSVLPVEAWKRQAGRMLGWLRHLTHPDGRIAFFQDAAFDMAPSPGSLAARAAGLGITPLGLPLAGSGYARLETGGTVMLADTGSPGPAHQPGHAHAGALSLELSHRGRRFLVNSGTSTYEPGPRRDFERSTAAHNTLRLDGRDQSELWAAFRLGRRARVTTLRRTPLSVAAQHDGFSPVTHRRDFCLQPDLLTVEDRLEGAGRAWVEVFFHLHPDVRVEGDLTLRHAGGAAIRLLPPPGVAIQIQETLWSPEFGLQLPNHTIVFRIQAPLPAHLTTRIELLP